jgi:PAS domain S-box-containing protein
MSQRRYAAPPLAAVATASGSVPTVSGPTMAMRVLLAVVAVAVLFFGSTAWLARSIVEERFTAVEQDLVIRNRAVLTRVLRAEIASLAAVAGDMGQWNELYAFGVGTNPGFAASHLGPVAIERLRVDLALLFDTRGRIIHSGRSSELAPNGPASEQAITAALGRRAAAQPRGSVAGLLDTVAGPLVVAAHPILRNDATGPAAGTLVLARRLNVARLSSELSVLPAQVSLYGSQGESGMQRNDPLLQQLTASPRGARIELRAADLSDYQLFRDLNGAPAFVLESRMDRSVALAGVETARMVLALAGAGTLVALGTLLLVFHQLVTTPVRRLIRYVLALQDVEAGAGRSGPTPCRDQTDEIGMLAREFEALLDGRDADALALARLAAAVDHAADAIAVLDRYGNIAYVNARYEQHTGFAAAEVIGQPPGRAGPDRTRLAELWATVRQGQVWSGLLEARTRDGRQVFEDVTVAPIQDHDGEITSYVAVMRDATARLKAEAELRKLAAIAEHASESIAVLDARGAVEYVNPAFERQRGTTLAAVRGKHPSDSSEGLDPPEFYAAIWSTVMAGQAWSGRVRVHVRATGQTLTEDVVMSPVKDSDGTLSHIVVILHDVTQRVQLEAELGQARKLEAVGRLAGGVAHEINTPIHYISENVTFLVQSFACLGDLLQQVGRLATEASGGTVPAARLRELFAAAEVDYLQAEIPVALRQSLDGIDRVAGIVRSMKELAHPGEDLVITDVNPVVGGGVGLNASS